MRPIAILKFINLGLFAVMFIFFCFFAYVSINKPLPSLTEIDTVTMQSINNEMIRLDSVRRVINQY